MAFLLAKKPLISAELKKTEGVHALYVRCVGGKLDFASVEMK